VALPYKNKRKKREYQRAYMRDWRKRKRQEREQLKRWIQNVIATSKVKPPPSVFEAVFGKPRKKKGRKKK